MKVKSDDPTWSVEA